MTTSVERRRRFHRWEKRVLGIWREKETSRRLRRRLQWRGCQGCRRERIICCRRRRGGEERERVGGGEKESRALGRVTCHGGADQTRWCGRSRCPARGHHHHCKTPEDSSACCSTRPTLQVASFLSCRDTAMHCFVVVGRCCAASRQLYGAQRVQLQTMN